MVWERGGLFEAGFILAFGEIGYSPQSVTYSLRIEFVLEEVTRIADCAKVGRV